MFEPATPQEAKDMTLAAFALSEELGLPVLLRTTTRVNHTRGPVTLGEISAPAPGPLRQGPLFPGHGAGGGPGGPCPAPRQAGPGAAAGRDFAVQHVTGQGPGGIVTSGVAAAYVEDAILELSLTDRVTLLKLGFTYPLPEKLLADFLATGGAGPGGGGTGTAAWRMASKPSPSPGG